MRSNLHRKEDVVRRDVENHRQVRDDHKYRLQSLRVGIDEAQNATGPSKIILVDLCQFEMSTYLELLESKALMTVMENPMPDTTYDKRHDLDVEEYEALDKVQKKVAAACRYDNAYKELRRSYPKEFDRAGIRIAGSF